MHELLQRIAPLIHPGVGVVESVEPLVMPPGWEGVVEGYTARLGRIDALHPAGNSAGAQGERLSGSGTALDETTARVRATCEALERYCSVMYPVDGVVTVAEQELGDAAIGLDRWPRCSVEEIESAEPAQRLWRPEPTTPAPWVRGFSLTHQRAVWVPLSAAFMGLPAGMSGHVQFPISTGFAAGGDFASAALSGLLEVIERDSLALWWLQQLPMPRIDPASLGSMAVDGLVAEAAERGVDTALFDLSTDVGVPVVGVIQTSDRAWPHAVAMAACRTEIAAAAQRALEEAVSVRLALYWRQDRAVDREALFGGKPQSPAAFGLLYAGADGPAQLTFATKQSPRPYTGPRVSQGHEASADGTPQGHLARLVRRLDGLGMEVVVVDATLPEVDVVGLKVVKVLVPELMPITFSHGCRYLGHPRLVDGPRALGLTTPSGEPYSIETVTNAPIPFA